jgi:hypothetical protein
VADFGGILILRRFDAALGVPEEGTQNPFDETVGNFDLSFIGHGQLSVTDGFPASLLLVEREDDMDGVMVQVHLP